MSKTPHAAARAPQQAEEPKATLPQLGELVAQMEKGLVPRAYMQDFLRRRLVRPGPVQAVSPPEPAPNTLLVAIEKIAREHYPHAVNEILEVVAPFCDPNLDLEFKPFSRREELLEEKLRKALFWLRVEKVEVLALRYPRSSGLDEAVLQASVDFRLHKSVHNEMFAEVFRTYDLLNTVSDKGAKEIAWGDGPGQHLIGRLEATGAYRYGLISGCSELEIFEHQEIVDSITYALRKAILFAVTGDKARLRQVVDFLDFQRSGHPVYHWHEGTAYVLALCETK